MSLPNHVVGGIMFTGFFGAIADINVLQSPWTFATAIFFAILPDVDHPPTWMGRLFGWTGIPNYLSTHHGHRTITHSLWVHLGITIIAYFVESLFWEKHTFTVVISLSFFSHQLLDFPTKSGVIWLYPLSRIRFVLPGRRDARIETGNFQQEGIVFVLLSLATISLAPMMEKGFWTSFNQTFATPVHLVAEFNSSKTVVSVDYIYRVGTEEIKGHGDCIKPTGSKVVLLEENGFVVLDASKGVIVETMPIPTNKIMDIREINFWDISVDSLNKMIRRNEVLELEVLANNKFIVQSGVEAKRTNSYKGEYINDLIIREEIEKIERKEFKPTKSPRIKTLNQKIATLRRNYKKELGKYNRFVQRKERLNEQFAATSDLVEREKILTKVENLKEVEKPEIDNFEIQLLQAEIAEIREEDKYKNEMKRLEIDEDYKSRLPEKTKYSGILKTIKIYDQQTEN